MRGKNVTKLDKNDSIIFSFFIFAIRVRVTSSFALNVDDIRFVISFLFSFIVLIYAAKPIQTLIFGQKQLLRPTFLSLHSIEKGTSL